MGGKDKASVSEARSTITCYKYNSENHTLYLESQWKTKHGLENLIFTSNNLAVYCDLEILYALDISNPTATPKSLYKLSPEEGGSQARNKCFFMNVNQDILNIEITQSLWKRKHLMSYKLDELKNLITNPESKDEPLVSRFTCKGKKSF